jgi:hypothetical protein
LGSILLSGDPKIALAVVVIPDPGHGALRDFTANYAMSQFQFTEGLQL